MSICSVIFLYPLKYTCVKPTPGGAVILAAAIELTAGCKETIKHIQIWKQR